MNPRFELPSNSTLLAFEAAARLGSLSRAAAERRTSQSAMSRHVRSLEKTLGVKLFHRFGRGITLTKNGEEYFVAVQSSMESLHATGLRLRAAKPGLSIGCTLEISGLVLLPIFSRLKRSLGDDVTVRLMVYDYDVLPLLVRAGIDIIFEDSVGGHPDEDSVKVVNEEIVPVASPDFMRRFGPLLAKHPRYWSGVPRLDIGRRSPGWATWEKWFEAHGCTPPDAPVETFENYIHVLRAAADGDGIAIGWNGFMTDYVQAGRLVAIRDAWLPTELAMYAVLTQSGKTNHAARSCLSPLASLIGELRSSSPAGRAPGQPLAEGSEAPAPERPEPPADSSQAPAPAG
jgi:LysR family glycine cleavage system transcriptional activator